MSAWNIETIEAEVRQLKRELADLRKLVISQGARIEELEKQTPLSAETDWNRLVRPDAS